MKLLLIRHAQSQANVTGEVSSVMPGRDLTELGQSQAKKTGQELAKLYKIHRLYTSPMRRTQHTAKLINTFLKVEPMVQDARLSEMYFGEYNGRPSGEMYDSWHAFMKQVGEQNFAARIGQTGESEFAFRDRLLSFLFEVAARYDSDDVVAAVTHQAPAKVLQQFISPDVETALLDNADYVVMSLTKTDLPQLLEERNALERGLLDHLDLTA